MSVNLSFRQWMNQVKASSLAEALGATGSQRIGRYAVEAGPASGANFVDDIGLRSQGVRLSRTPGAHSVESPAQYWVLATRTGIVLSAVQQTQKHLQKRISEGKSTLQQKTVQSEIGEALSLVSEVLALTDLDTALDSLPALSSEEYAHLSRCLTQAGAIVSRLMGGHGYTKGGIEFPLQLSHHLWAISQAEVANV